MNSATDGGGTPSSAQEAQGRQREARLNSLELIFKPALLAAVSLIWKRILFPCRMKLIMPPDSVNRPISATVSTLASRRLARISGRRAFSEAQMKRMWQFVVSADDWNCLTTSGRLLMVLSRIVCSRTSPKGFSPRIPKTMGDVVSPKAADGHSTNFAKLSRKAALSCCSVGGDSCARPATGASSPTRHRHKILVARKRMKG